MCVDCRSLSGRRVLIVEDDYFLATDLASLIRRAGGVVIGPVANVRDAVAALEFCPDLASLDVQLGVETSFAIADELARLGIPFVFATASAAEIPAAHVGRPVCVKPITDRNLLEVLECAFLASRQM